MLPFTFATIQHLNLTASYLVRVPMGQASSAPRRTGDSFKRVAPRLPQTYGLPRSITATIRSAAGPRAMVATEPPFLFQTYGSQGGGYGRVTRRFRVDRATVKRYCKQLDERGTLEPRKTPDKAPKLDEGMMRLLEKDLKERLWVTHSQRAGFLFAGW
jgi:hypothetical protein